MKLLLTSAGISNKTIENELKRLLNNKILKDIKVLFCTTASNYEGGGMSDWLVKDLIYFYNQGIEIDVCDINGISKDKFISRFEWADILFFEGGYTKWLLECIKNTGLENEIQRLLEDKVWIGASAGSCVTGNVVFDSVQDLFKESIDYIPCEGLNLVDFIIIPHLNNEYFPMISIENINNVQKNLEKIHKKNIYFLDDESAISVEDGTINIVSEGKWYKI